jgi:hypothetical protein
MDWLDRTMQQYRVARWYIFKPKIPIRFNFDEP